MPKLNKHMAHRLALAFDEAIRYQHITPLMDISAQLAALHRHGLERLSAEQRTADRVWLQFQRIAIAPSTLRQISTAAYIALTKQLAQGRPATEAARRLRIVLSDMQLARRPFKISEWNATLHAFSVCGDLASMERVWQRMRAIDAASRAKHREEEEEEGDGEQCRRGRANRTWTSRANWLIAYNTRLHAYASDGALDAVEWVWSELMHHPGLEPDRIAWNTRIHAHAMLGHIDDMERYAREMATVYRLAWDAYTQQALLVGYGRANRWDAVERIRAMLEQREAVWVAAKFGGSRAPAKRAASTTRPASTASDEGQSPWLPDELPEPSAHNYTALMSLHIRRQDYAAASRTLERMLTAGVQPTQATVNVVLRMHVEQGDINGALWILHQLTRRSKDGHHGSGLPTDWRPDAYTASILLDACSRQGAYEEMHRVRQIMVASGVRFTLVTLTALAIGYAKAGRSQDARYFAERSRQAILDEPSQHRPLADEEEQAADACSSTRIISTALRARAGSRVAEAVSVGCAVVRALSDAQCPDGAQAVWQDLVASGLPLDADEHNTLLYALGERHDLAALRRCYHERIGALLPRDDAAEHMGIDEAPRAPPANVKTFSVMIRALTKHGELDVAEHLYQQLLWLASLPSHLQFQHWEADGRHRPRKPHLHLTAVEHARVFSMLVAARLRRQDEQGAYHRYKQLAPSLKSALSTPIYTALMDAAARKKRWSRVYHLLTDLLASNSPLDTTAYNALLLLCGGTSAARQ
ncbi:hypothetical protein SYNPS1DRAFT_22647 [Syncephalis pseudoplumigaleata]|uniref:Pentacotripeptide-repeat region of PRORP domain-containing protein n=1 Tax=Syncephalis pseudoplumigaleata TaxID=1712513 RepID=A0A4P9Z0I7_9FUNG|nr:hypothetical protein SYNPS1DRAFT_22647 [Syncephalis pseudoplumigaleata]|eukprot:RKP25382.1 hypothetical protein SYNPS1DRAFT_22647 [Syncephalis pseudoplumigaleata]